MVMKIQSENKPTAQNLGNILSDQVRVCFSFESDWLRKRHEFSRAIKATTQNQSNPWKGTAAESCNIPLVKLSM